jgi:hypothetical protein
MYGEMSKDPTHSKIKQQIDENLKRVYDAALGEEVPDRFKVLLEQLRKQQDSSGEKP